MDLKTYFDSKHRGSKMLFAEEIGITQTWLSLLISKVRTPSPLLARRIQKATKGKVKAKELRPDLFN